MKETQVVPRTNKKGQLPGSAALEKRVICVFLAVISFKMSKTQDKKKKEKEQHRVASVRKEIQQKRKQ